MLKKKIIDILISYRTFQVGYGLQKTVHNLEECLRISTDMEVGYIHVDP